MQRDHQLTVCGELLRGILKLDKVLREDDERYYVLADVELWQLCHFVRRSHPCLVHLGAARERGVILVQKPQRYVSHLCKGVRQQVSGVPLVSYTVVAVPENVAGYPTDHRAEQREFDIPAHMGDNEL